MTGLVFPDQGAALQKQLQPGQRLVTARGDLWRWDGYAASADAPSPAAVRLSQRNRLSELEQRNRRRQGNPGREIRRLVPGQGRGQAAREAARAAENAERKTEQSLIAAQDESTRAARAAAERASQLANLEAEIRRLEQSVAAAERVARSRASGTGGIGRRYGA